MATVSSEHLPADTLFLTQSPSPKLVRVARRGPVLRPSPSSAGVYGLDLTAGCLHGCPFCHIRGSSRYPGEDRVLFDPFTADRLEQALDDLEIAPRRVVLSPSSDPLPAVREIRDVTFATLELLLQRRIPVQVMTRGRISRRFVDLFARNRELVTVAVALMTMDRGLSRHLEGRCATACGRVADLRRLVAAGVDVEVRLEPLVPGLTDTRENLGPVLSAVSSAGAQRVVAHYLFLQAAMIDPLEQALLPLGRAERLKDDFENGPVFRVGTLGPTKHLPLEARRTGLTRLIALGAEYNLSMTTGSAQNPDLPRLKR